jgi:long-chain acyl-CoA synthetase
MNAETGSGAHPWLASYAPGVPATIDPDSYRGVAELLAEACAKHAKRRALGCLGSFLTYAELARASAGFAAYLVHACAVVPGQRVALMMPNTLAYPVAMLGVLRAGAVVVNVNPQYTARELAHQLADSGASVLVVFEHALATYAEAAADYAVAHVVVTRVGDLMPPAKGWLIDRLVAWRARRRPRVSIKGVRLPRALALATRERPPSPAAAPDALAFLQYTGGTTGRAKGAMLSQRNIVANILQVRAWLGDLRGADDEIVITALPLYHIYALTANCLSTLSEGGLVYLIVDPRDLDGFVRELKRVRFTAVSGVNTLFNALLGHPRIGEVDFSSLRVSNGGGAAVHSAVASAWHARTGSAIAEGYGLTEASPVVTVNRLDRAQFTGSIGLPVPSTECRIVDEQGVELGFDMPGELIVRGPQVMQGYWKQPAETRAVLDADGWLRTGDIAIMAPDGSLRIVDRKKDLILVSGFNVYPNEIEDVIAKHAGVAEVAVIGIADARSGEAVRAVVVKRDARLTADALASWCREQLTGYKLPRSIVFVDALPKSNVGKILRREVRTRFGA